MGNYTSAACGKECGKDGKPKKVQFGSLKGVNNQMHVGMTLQQYAEQTFGSDCA